MSSYYYYYYYYYYSYTHTHSCFHACSRRYVHPEFILRQRLADVYCELFYFFPFFKKKFPGICISNSSCGSPRADVYCELKRASWLLGMRMRTCV